MEQYKVYNATVADESQTIAVCRLCGNHTRRYVHEEGIVCVSCIRNYSTEKVSDNQNRYEIGGVCVWMTSAQAAYWNEGPVDWNWEVFEGATVYVPRRDKISHPYEDSFSLKNVVEKDIEKMYSLMMEGCSANEIN